MGLKGRFFAYFGGFKDLREWINIETSHNSAKMTKRNGKFAVNLERETNGSAFCLF